MLEKLIMPGVKLELREIRKKEDMNNKANIYVSQVYDMGDEESKLVIAMPIKAGKLILLSVGACFEAFFYTKKGMYQSEIVVTDRYKSDNLYMLDVTMKTPLKKFQRRQFYRFDCMLDVDYTLLTDSEEQYISTTKQIPEELSGDKRTAMTKNISGGGIKIVGDQKLEKDDKLYVYFELMVNEYVKTFRLVTRVIDCNEVMNRTGMYTSRLEFEHIRNEEREIIIKYIFEEERRIRKNERM